jgi:14-3-3 protein epsilon
MNHEEEKRKNEKTYMGKLAEYIERFEDTVTFINQIFKEKKELTSQERALLSTGYKNTISKLRKTWRTVSIKEEEHSKRNVRLIGRHLIENEIGGEQEMKQMAAVKFYREMIEEKIEKKCLEILSLLNQLINPTIYSSNSLEWMLIKSTTLEIQVFYLKLRGDYFRYLCEFSSNEE